MTDRHTIETAQHQTAIDKQAAAQEQKEADAKKIDWNDRAEKLLVSATDEDQSDFLTEYSIKHFDGNEAERAAMFRYLTWIFTDWRIDYKYFDTGALQRDSERIQDYLKSLRNQKAAQLKAEYLES